MQQFIKVVMASAALTLATTSIVLAAEPEDFAGTVNGNIQNGKKIFENGKGSVPACLSCHGQKGLGDDNMGTPRLAGQGEMYIYKQLTDFATDKRKDQTMFVMNDNAKGLTDQDRRDVAAFVNSLRHPWSGSDMAEVKKNSNPVGVRYLGMSIVQHGAPAAHIPACRACHSYNGRGAPPIYPTIGGQRYVYLINQLKHWRDSSRANDIMGQMQAVAHNMTDQDIYNVATFLTNAPRSTMGDGNIPPDLH